MLELANKSEKIQQLAWEPRGSRFALLHGEGNRPTGEAIGWLRIKSWDIILQLHTLREGNRPTGEATGCS